MAHVEIWRGNIVEAPAEAIVNAANERLSDGSGVCGAIYAAAGHQELGASCRAIGGCEVGQAAITPAHALESRGIKKIIHAVGPRWHSHEPTAADALLESAYRSSLALAEAEGLTSIAFPPISTGIFDFPKDRAADIAVRVAQEHSGSVSKILLVAFDDGVENDLRAAMLRR